MSQNNNFAYRVLDKKANWPGIVQQPVNTRSRNLGLNPAGPCVYYRLH